MKKMGLIKDTSLKEEIPLVDVNFTHSLCIGQTGSGKTTSFIYPNIKHRMELGHGILFFDIKGSEHLALKKLALDAGRLGDVIEIGKPWGSNINILESLNSVTFARLLKDIVGNPAHAGSNTFFYNEAISLGLGIYNVLKLKSIISQEVKEISEEFTFETLKNEEFFTLNDMYDIIYTIDTLYSFIQETQIFTEELHTFITKNTELYYSQYTDRYKNLVLNYSNLTNTMHYFKKYDVAEDQRSNTEKFETALLSVISTLSSGFGFLGSASSKYISQKENPLHIVQALQEEKIIIINVRVIPDMVLELMLEQLFEQMIDLNLQSEADKKPISIFIDEAQRLINKDIPLDVLRSSKVDVLMAVQSELQLISKFKSREDWQQISVNIAQKFAFRSTFFGGDHLLSFYVDTATLNTFEYAKEHESSKLKANPLFLNKEKFDAVEYEYQKNVLKLKDIKEDEILFYDVTHFENEREIILINIKTKAKSYQKLFTQTQEDTIERELFKYLRKPYEMMLDSSLVKGIIPPKIYKKMYEEYGKDNEFKIKDSFTLDTYTFEYKTVDRLFSALYSVAVTEDSYAKNEYVYHIFHSFSNDGDLDIEEDDYEPTISTQNDDNHHKIFTLLEKHGIFSIQVEDTYRLYIMDPLTRGEKEVLCATGMDEELSF